MMPPHQEAEDGDREAGKPDHAITKRPLSTKTGNDLAHHSHAWQDHDVDCGVRIKPEQMLKQHRVASQLWIKDADVQPTFHSDQEQRDRYDWGAEYKDDARGIDRPEE